jgi:hypothetical protein
MVGPYHNIDRPSSPYTLTALKRWSCDDQPLPPVAKIRAIHIYDFDNTLFMSPLPNKAIWQAQSIGMLQNQDIFVNGGWWHDAGILSATGEGVEIEDPRAWKGWWNEKVVQLVLLSMDQKDVLTVLLTGRAEANFAELVKRMCKSKYLEFDMFCLKPLASPSNQTFTTTMNFKQELLKSIMYTYRDADDIVIYEDRPRHVTGFRTFLAGFNDSLLSAGSPVPRKKIKGLVVEVAEIAAALDPVAETAEIQRMVNAHNLAIRAGTASEQAVPMRLVKSVFFTAYRISPVDSQRLVKLASIPPNYRETTRHLANSIMISQGAAKPAIMKTIGGIGTAVRFQVVSTAAFEQRIWAARVEPVRPSTKIHTESSPAVVVLAIRPGTQPYEVNKIRNWQPVSKEYMFQFEAVVGEKFILSLERQRNGRALEPSARAPRDHLNQRSPGQISEDDYQPPPTHPRGPARTNSNPHPRDRRGGDGGHYRGGSRDRGRGSGRRGETRGRGPYPPRNGTRGGRGRGGYPSYRSLDDVEDRGGYQPRYTDYDAQGTGGTDKDSSMYNAY